MLQIYHNTSTDYGPSTELSLEDKIRQLTYLRDQGHPAFSKWPFGNDPQTVKASQRFVGDVYNDAFKNPIPKHMGEPAYVGPYLVGSYLNPPGYDKSQGTTDGDIEAINNYSAKKGLLSDVMAKEFNDNLLSDPSEDYMSFVNAGEMSLEDAIRMMGYVPYELRGLLGE